MAKIQLFRKVFQNFTLVNLPYNQGHVDFANAFHEKLKFRNDVRYRYLSNKISAKVFPVCVAIASEAKLNKKQFEKLYVAVFWTTFTFILPDRTYSQSKDYKERNRDFKRSREYSALKSLYKKAELTLTVLRGHNNKIEKRYDTLTGEHFEPLFPVAEMESAVQQFKSKVDSWGRQFLLIEEKSNLKAHISELMKLLDDKLATSFLISFFEDLERLCRLFYSIRNSLKIDGQSVDPVIWEPKIKMNTLGTYLSEIRAEQGRVRPRGRPPNQKKI
jgi:hypothetical protein